MGNVLVDPATIPEVNAAGLIVKNLIGPATVGAKNIRMGTCRVPRGSSTSLNYHPSEEAFAILKGEGYLKAAGEKYYFRPGHFLYVPADVVHQMVNTGDEEIEYLFVVSPPFDLSAVRLAEESPSTPEN